MYYFVSDTHLKYGGTAESREREMRLVRWLDEVGRDARGIYLLGDIFDFWYEHRRVAPKGFTRLLGKLSELTDRGVEVHFFTGNHDMWCRDYLERECGVKIHFTHEETVLCGRRLLLGHGDNIHVPDPVVRFMNNGFRCRTLRWMFSWLVHPDIALRFGQWWSGSSRKSKSISGTFRGEGEWLVQFAREYSRSHSVDYFVFGHIHCAEEYDMGGGVKAFFLGEWFGDSPVYGALSPDGSFELRKVKP